MKHSVGDYCNLHTVNDFNCKFTVFTGVYQAAKLEIESLSVTCTKHLEVQIIQSNKPNIEAKLELILDTGYWKHSNDYIVGNIAIDTLLYIDMGSHPSNPWNKHIILTNITQTNILIIHYGKSK